MSTGFGAGWTTPILRSFLIYGKYSTALLKVRDSIAGISLHRIPVGQDPFTATLTAGILLSTFSVYTGKRDSVKIHKFNCHQKTLISQRPVATGISILIDSRQKHL
jgi:hypothetical protein